MSYTLGAYTKLTTSSIKKSPSVLLKIFFLLNSVFLVFFIHINFPVSSSPDEVRVSANFTIPNDPLPIITLSSPFLFFSFVLAIFSSKNPSGISPESLIFCLSYSLKLFSNKYNPPSSPILMLCVIPN